MSNASQPDGTDPRVLTPEGREVVTPNTNGANAHQRYHKPGCRRIDTMERPSKRVDVAVAKWKDLKPCQTCHGDERNHNGNGTAIEGPTVDRWRRALVWTDGGTREIAAGGAYSPTTVRRHARGIATDNYNTDPTVPPARWSHPDQTWVFDE